VHVLGLFRHDRVHLDVEPVIVFHVLLLSGEDIVLLDVGIFRVIMASLSRLSLTVLIPLPFSRLARWRPRQLVVSLLQVSGETALARGVTRWLA
jgi:hypothetical protein